MIVCKKNFYGGSVHGSRISPEFGSHVSWIVIELRSLHFSTHVYPMEGSERWDTVMLALNANFRSRTYLE